VGRKRWQGAKRKPRCLAFLSDLAKARRTAFEKPNFGSDLKTASPQTQNTVHDARDPRFFSLKTFPPVYFAFTTRFRRGVFSPPLAVLFDSTTQKHLEAALQGWPVTQKLALTSPAEMAARALWIPLPLKRPPTPGVPTIAAPL
jgi:hypothetical protein